MNLSEQIKALDYKGRDFPLIAGTVKFKLHNVHNGKDEVIEEHNMVTNALADIFTNNYGGLINYQNFADLYNTWLGGVLLFQNQLDLTSADDYGIPDNTTNPIKAHAGQTPLSDQADDLTRGNPDSTGTVLASGSTKLRWEWGTSAGNGTIASLGLTHTDTGSYGTGIASTAQMSLSPFVAIGNMTRGGSYSDNINSAMAVNDNIAYKFYLPSTTSVKIYKAPINVTKFKLQGSALLPISAYASAPVTATLPNAYWHTCACYYHFDFANNKLMLFGVPSNNQTKLYQDTIDLDSGAVTHKEITVTGAMLWGFHTSTRSGYGVGDSMLVPTKAIIFNNYIYVYGNTSVLSGYHPMKMYKINLTDNTDQEEIDTSLLTTDLRLDGENTSATANLVTPFGGIIVHNCYLINDDVMYPLTISRPTRTNLYSYGIYNSVSAPAFSTDASINVIYACKLYLATKFNLSSAVTKTSAQSMTVEYSLQEV